MLFHMTLSSGVLYTVPVGLIFTVWTSPCYFHKHQHHKEESNTEDYHLMCILSITLLTGISLRWSFKKSSTLVSLSPPLSNHIPQRSLALPAGIPFSRGHSPASFLFLQLIGIFLFSHLIFPAKNLHLWLFSQTAFISSSSTPMARMR